MEIKLHQATREISGVTQIAECFEIGRLAICRETTDFRIHLLYQKDVTALLRDAGYEIQTKEIHISGWDEDFSELQYALYEGDGCEIYLFRWVAVRVAAESIQYCAESGLTKEALKRMWDEPAVDWEKPVKQYNVPADQIGNLAVRIEAIAFDSWDLLIRGPGEFEETEERLDQVQQLYNDIKQKGSADSFMDILKEDLSDWMDEYSSDFDSLDPKHQEYVSEMIDDGNRFIAQLENLRCEYTPALCHDQAETQKTEA